MRVRGDTPSPVIGPAGAASRTGESSTMTRRPLDPRNVPVTIDANALDEDGSARDALIERLRALASEGRINLIVPGSVRAEIEHPHTPGAVKEAALPQIFSYRVELNEAEQQMRARVRSILQGNARPGKHDADAEHVCEAAKYAGFFITNDARILAKRSELETVLPPHFWIVTIERYLENLRCVRAGLTVTAGRAPERRPI